MELHGAACGTDPLKKGCERSAIINETSRLDDEGSGPSGTDKHLWHCHSLRQNHHNYVVKCHR